MVELRSEVELRDVEEWIGSGEKPLPLCAGRVGAMTEWAKTAGLLLA